MKHFLLLLTLLLSLAATAQHDSLAVANTLTGDSVKGDDIKTGFTFGVLPAIAYDSDLGFKYGGLINLYYFGDGSTYPDYMHSIYLEWNRTTKGSGTNQFFYDSPMLFGDKDIRVTLDASYLTEQALDFYGFNGAEANYSAAFEEQDAMRYISRMYYRYERKMLRLTGDFQGKIIGKKLRWLFGVAHFNNKIGTVDIEQLNKGKDSDDLLPDTLTLYDKYVDWGIIPGREADGGVNNYLKAGVVYDTRNIEANPSKGMWSEVLLVTAPRFFGNKENAFTKLVAIHRQYFTLVPDRLTFVYRLGYQGTIHGNAPFYMQSYMFMSYSPSVITEGLGGAKSLRGIKRNRVIGDGFAYSNIEFRYKFLKTKIKRQNLYLALNTFTDIGTILDPVAVDRSLIPAGENEADYFNEQQDKLHFTYGLGLHAALNENFVLSVNFGIAADKQDGTNGLYIGTNWLF